MFERQAELSAWIPSALESNWNLKVTTVRPHAGSHFHASSNPFSSVSCSLLSGRTSHEQCPTRTIERHRNLPLGVWGISSLLVQLVQVPCRLRFLASDFAFSSLSCFLFPFGTSHEVCPTRTFAKAHRIFRSEFLRVFFDRMNTADTLGWEIKNGWSCLGFTEMWNMALASAAAYRNINQCHVMNHANASGPFHSQFMSLHGLSEVGLLSARHLRQGFWGSLIPR